MDNQQESAADILWREYARVFNEFDDLTLARWLAQTVGQLEGKAWRLSHPLVGAYRLAAQVAHDRQIWFKRLATVPAVYQESVCCRAPALPMFTRDIQEDGLLCFHCGETLLPFAEIALELQLEVGAWAKQYTPIHQVAHWDDEQRKRELNYDSALEQAAAAAEELLAQAAREILPKFLEYYPAIVWEDHDECLEVHPEDIDLRPA